MNITGNRGHSPILQIMPELTTRTVLKDSNYKEVNFDKPNDFVKNWFRSLMRSHLGCLKLRAQIILVPLLIICWFVSPPLNYYVWKFSFFFV